MLSSNEQDIDDSLNGPFLLDNSDKNLESEENVIFMQYLTGDNMDTKISPDSGSDVDEDSDDDNDDPTYRTYPGPPIPVEVPPHMIPIPHPHHLEQQHHHHQLQQQRMHQLQQQQAQVAQQQHHQRQHQQHAQVQQQQQQIQQVQQNNGESSNMVYHTADEAALVTFTSKGRLKWTPAMDKLLREGVEKHQGHGVGMWKKVADHVSQGLGIANGGLLADGSRLISNHQCGERYKHHLDPALDARKSGPWTEEDIENLKRLVAENTSHDESGVKKKSVINWVKISIILNRHYRDCQHKWINLMKSELKTGVFTKEEEELLMRRVGEWGDRGKGIWVTLEKELGRRNRSILDKYRRMVKKKTS